MGNSQPIVAQYACFREDIPAKPGHTKELINIAHKDNPGHLDPAEFEGLTTIE
jgi:hypothetical protein